MDAKPRVAHCRLHLLLGPFRKKFGNYKKALVRVEKQTAPDGAAGSFAFTSTIPGKPSFDLSDGGVEATSVDPGSYTASGRSRRRRRSST